MYDWVLHWADTPYALRALFLISFAESSFFPIPPDVLLIPLVLRQQAKAMVFAFWCTLASVLGGMFGYALGFFLWESGVREFCFSYLFSEARFTTVEALYEDHGFWIVFTAGFSPIPYKLFTLSSGALHDRVPFWIFVIASVLSRGLRFYLEALLLRRYGKPIRSFFGPHLGIVSLLFCVLLVGGFVLVKYLW